MTQTPNKSPTIQRGLEYLRRSQSNDGSFYSFTTQEGHNFTSEKRYKTTFTPALILHSLAQLNDTYQTQDIIGPLTRYLISQKSSAWTFNYWDRHSPEARTMPYPDDLDDTFCTLAALWHADPNQQSDFLPSALKLLTSTEAHIGGPYYTWIVPPDVPDTWRDIDLAVNCNVAYFLRLHEVTLPSLDALFEQAIESVRLESRYYPTPYSLAYFICRGYRGNKVPQLLGIIKKLQQSALADQSPLAAALVTLALYELNEPITNTDAVRNFLESKQLPDGSWPAEAFCYDPSIANTAYVSGAPALTTAFCIEALHRLSLEEITSSSHPDTFVVQIAQHARQQLQHYPVAIQRSFSLWINHIVTHEHRTAALTLHRTVARAFGAQNRVPPDLLITLGTGALFGWIAYTILDNIMDEESPPDVVPLAAIAQREMTLQFLSSLPQASQTYKRVMAHTDSANYWETTCCRIGSHSLQTPLKQVDLPSYQQNRQLAQRSLGHTLSSLCILLYLSYGPSSATFKNMEQFFTHYIIARQLSDDIHDWKTDLRRGHLTSVVTDLLRKARATFPATHQIQSLDSLEPELEQLFWHKILPRICDTILHHLERAQAALQDTPGLADITPLLELLRPVAASIEKTKQTHKQVEGVLRSFGSNQLI